MFYFDCARVSWARNVYTLNLTMFSFVMQQSNRVTLKMEVSYTDHSHIIGRGGNTISRVMEDTHCHVHFPGGHGTISIRGSLDSVLQARLMLMVFVNICLN